MILDLDCANAGSRLAGCNVIGFTIGQGRRDSIDKDERGWAPTFDECILPFSTRPRLLPNRRKETSGENCRDTPHVSLAFSDPCWPVRNRLSAM